MDKMNNTNKYPLLMTNQGNIIFPGQKGPLEFVDQFSSKAAEVAVDKYEGFAIITVENNDSTKAKQELDIKDNLNKFGVLAKITIMKKWNDGTVTVDVDAKQRVEIKDIELENNSYLVGSYTVAKDDELTAEQKEKFKQDALKLANLVGEFGDDLKAIVEKDKYDNLDKSLSAYLEEIFNKLSISDKKATTEFLQDNNPLTKLETLLQLVLSSIDTTEVEQEINKKMKSKIDAQQKEFYLREKLKAIKDELGEDGSNSDNSIESYKKRLESEPFPEQVKERILNEIDKYEGMQSSSAEGNIQRSYIDWMMQIPWYEKSKDKTDLNFAQEVLDEHHYGLKKIKERIIEYLAAKQKTGSVKGQIITLVGPPGVGKTSLAKSIAEAIGRNFVKVSLGGVKDEAEIRGHRRTYVGAMPGRIIQSMKRAKTTNPLFLLDEIDKMASDYKGDPASAMLEVLDPEQNAEFSDNYIEEPYDLSDVMFIATANVLQDIPEALYDRMEIINLSSYTEIEKLQIAEKYLVPNVLKEYKLTDKELKFTDDGIKEVIKFYTREAGVRQLERWLNTIARKFIVKQLKENLKEIVITPDVVKELLGKHIFENTKKEDTPQVGVVTGLAWTQVGGEILPIEANYFPGKGNLVLTGQLGDVMKESAHIALDFVKANHEKFGIDKSIFEENDIHIHAPEGAVPKDGPSAGVTLTTAIISALTKKPVSEFIGMTGEITLQGHVLPIGGLREKSIAAARSGLKKILIPWDNQKDIEDIPEEVQKTLIIKPMKEYSDVYKQVFETPIDK